MIHGIDCNGSASQGMLEFITSRERREGLLFLKKNVLKTEYRSSDSLLT
jgi:hypothetical protein